MGGWTRIWVVVTTIAAAVAATDYYSAMRAAESNAQNSMNGALSDYDNCRKQLAEPRQTDSQLAEQAKGAGLDAYLAQGMLSNAPQRGNVPKSPTSAMDRYLAAVCGYAMRPREQYALEHAKKRDDAITTAKKEAAGRAMATVGWVSGTVGALFVAVGWIRRGFRKKTHG